MKWVPKLNSLTFICSNLFLNLYLGFKCLANRTIELSQVNSCATSEIKTANVSELCACFDHKQTIVLKMTLTVMVGD